MKTFKRLFRLGAVVLALMCAVSTVAEAAVFYSYSYDNDGNANASPDGALPVKTVYGDSFAGGSLSSPQDICIHGDKLYIADTKNNRIVVTDTSFTVASIIDSFERGGKRETFSEPNGLCVTDDAVYIADTGNARVIKLSLDGGFLLEITTPDDSALPDDFFFKPTKVAVDGYGRVFVISAGYNMGLMQFDGTGTYLKSFGAPKVSLSVVEQIWRKFSTKAQQERTQSVVPTEYSNLYVNADGFIYVTSESTSDDVSPLRKLNANGSDILTSDNSEFGDLVTGGVTYQGSSQIVDFCVMENGCYAILDRKRSRIFVYNKESEMLYAFGGPGAYSGGLSVASAMEYKDGRFYITDSSKNAVCVFELTEYGRLFASIAKAREEIDFESEAALWNEVMARNENCLLAVKGLGDAAYKKHDMRLAMQYYKKADDREDYSKAYTFVRREWIERNAYLILVAVALVITAAVLLGRLYKKRLAAADRNSFLSREHFSSYVCYHPLDGFWDLKREGRGTVGMGIFWFAATAVVLVANSLCVGFIFNTTNLDTYNMLGNIAFITAALLLWCIAQWCVTSIMDGEGKFKDIFIATCYALRPYCILSLVAIALSNVLSQTEGDFYYVLTALALLWTVALLVAGLMQTHNYSLGKTVLVIIIILVVILLITFIGMLVFALCQQLTAFIKDLINEVQLRV